MRKWVIKKGNKYWSRFVGRGFTDDIYKAEIWPHTKVQLERGEELVPVEVEIKELRDEPDNKG